MNDAILERLLCEEESASLDFKRDQYPFDSAADDQKGELLKDILAFANAWRRETAYILIGVEEVRGGRSKILGTRSHLSDHDLQQFVCSKTNRPVAFSYTAYSYGGVPIGIIEVPLQERPVFLLKKFGRLERNQVYIRRNSSTVVASPDEIARMGAADSAARRSEQLPTFDLAWGNLEDRRGMGQSIDLSSIRLEPKAKSEQFAPSAPAGGFFGSAIRYYTDIIEYVYQSALLTPVGVVVTNTSNIVGRQVALSAVLPKIDGVTMVDSSEIPRRPSQSLMHVSLPIPLGDRSCRPEVEEYADHWEIRIRFGDILPKDRAWTLSPLYFGSRTSLRLTIPAKLFAANLPSPQETNLMVTLVATTRAMTPEDIERYFQESDDDDYDA